MYYESFRLTHKVPPDTLSVHHYSWQPTDNVVARKRMFIHMKIRVFQKIVSSLILLLNPPIILTQGRLLECIQRQKVKYTQLV